MAGEMAGINIRQVEMRDVQHIMRWIHQEKWALHPDDIHLYIQLYGDGFFLAEQDGIPAGCVLGTKLNDATGHFGLFIVDKDKRGQNIGRALLEVSSSYLEVKQKTRNIGLNALPYMSPTYVKYGFPLVAWQCHCYAGDVNLDDVVLSSLARAQIVDVTHDNVIECSAYDYSIHSVDNRDLLEFRLKQSDTYTQMALVSGRVCGYGVLHPVVQGQEYMLGPLYADNAELAVALAVSLLKCQRKCSHVFMELLGPNITNTSPLIDMLKLECQATYNRQYTLENMHFQVEKVYSVTNSVSHPA